MAIMDFFKPLEDLLFSLTNSSIEFNCSIVNGGASGTILRAFPSSSDPIDCPIT
jgi:hypothetical protein